MVRDKPPSCAVPTCFEVIIACPNVTTLLAVNTLDKYELNDVLSGEPDSRDMKNGFALIIAGGKINQPLAGPYLPKDIPFHDSRVAAPSMKYTQRIRASPRISCGCKVSMIVGSQSRPSCSTSVVIYTLPPTSEPVADARMLMSERLGSLSCAYKCSNVADNEVMVEAKEM